MFDGVVIAPARLLGAPRNLNTVNEQAYLPLLNRIVVFEDRAQKASGSVDIGPKHVHDNGVVTNFSLSRLDKDTRDQKAEYEMARFNYVSFPFTEPLPTIDGPVVDW